MKDANLELYLIRHGESEANRMDKTHIGGRNPATPLSIEGISQANKLGLRFKIENAYFDAVYSSPIVRARQTCDLAISQTGFPLDKVTMAAEIVEQSQGAWEGQLRTDIYTDEVLIQMNKLGKFYDVPNGESQRRVERRVSNWLEDEILYNPIYRESPSKIAIFTHCQVIRNLLHYVMGFNDRLIHRIKIDNTSITKVVFDESGWTIKGINDTLHLSPFYSKSAGIFLEALQPNGENKEEINDPFRLIEKWMEDQLYPEDEW